MKKRKKSVDEVFEYEQKMLDAMQEMLNDYIETVNNEQLPETYNLKKWVASELIMFLAHHVGETAYEMTGILEDCKLSLRERMREFAKNMVDED